MHLNNAHIKEKYQYFSSAICIASRNKTKKLEFDKSKDFRMQVKSSEILRNVKESNVLQAKVELTNITIIEGRR